MKIELIGTGCIGTKQNSASSLINDNTLIDVPNGTCRILRNMGKSLNDIHTVIITHYHADHFFDIPFLILEKAIEENAKQFPFTIVGPKEIKEKTKELYDIAFPNSWEKTIQKLNLEFVEILPRETKTVNDVNIEAVKVEHDMPEAQGYIITINNNQCAFTGDSRKCEGIDYLISKAKILIADCANIEGGDTHMGINDIQEYTEKYLNKIIVTTHMKENVRTELEKLEIENLIIPEDLYTLDF